MQTAIQLVELSEESKTKVCLIQDIQKLNKLLTGRDITPEEFEECYARPISDLETAISNMEGLVRLKSLVELLKQKIGGL
jgi:hypothetical protein